MEAPFRAMPGKDPITGGELYISELRTLDDSVTIRGRFEMPKFHGLDHEQIQFLETFIRCRGMFNSVERELGISYPTVRGRLDSLITALGLTPAVAPTKKGAVSEERQRILDQLEAGEISADEAKVQLRQEAGGKR